MGLAHNMKANEIEVHYYLPDGVHSANAFAMAKAETEFIYLFKEIASQLDIELQLEATALSEGGIVQKWKAFNKHSAGGVSCVIAALALIASLVPKGDRELIELSKQEKRLSIELMQKQLEEDQEPESEIIEEAAIEISQNIKVVRRRSNFYQAIQSEEKIEAVEFTRKEDNEPIDKPIRINRPEFANFIALTGTLPTEIDGSATIEIISPVLKKGRFKWKGYYKGAPIDFWLQDKKFKESVLRREVDFHSGTTIDCVLEMKIKIDEIGVISTAGYYVKVVKEIRDQTSAITTESGESYYAEIAAEEDQFKLFEIN